MARKQDTYELPDETLQLIAAFPELAATMMQKGSEAQSAAPDVRRSDLISALRRISGPENPGVTRFLNNPNGSMIGMRAYRGANNPGILGMKYVAPNVTLPGAETYVPLYVPPYVPPIIDDTIDDDDIIDDDIIGDDVDDDLVDPYVPVGTEIIDGGGDDDDDDDDTDDGSGGTGTGTGGTGTGGTGTGGTGGTGESGGTGTAGTGAVGTASTGTTGTGSTGNGDSLRDAIAAAIGGSGASIDNSASGLDTSSASNSVGSALTADQLASLTKPKVPNVTLEVSGNGLTLDDAGSTSQTFDYPEFLTPDELKAYEAWMATQGGGKPIFDETAGTMEF